MIKFLIAFPLLFCVSLKGQATFAHLQNELDGSFVVLQDYDLRFTFDEYYNVSGDLKYEILNDANSTIPATLPTLSVTGGNNRLSMLDINCSLNLLTDAYYILKVTLSKNRILYLRFYLPHTTETCGGQGGPGDL